MISNTRDDGWASAYSTNKTEPVSYSDIYGSGTQTAQARVATHDIQDHSDFGTQVLGMKSWDGEDDEISPGTQKYFSELLHDGRMSSFELNAARIKPTTPQKNNGRKAFTVTIFPTSAASLKKPAPESKPSRWRKTPKIKPIDANSGQGKSMQDEGNNAKSQSYFTELLHTAKDIYQSGPKGEGQAVWTSYKHYLKEKRTGPILEMRQAKRTDEAPRKPSIERKATHPSTGLPSTMIHVSTKDVEQLKLRNDSVVSYGDISHSSREVPIKIQRTLVDMDKSLPPPPRLSAAPKSRQLGAQGKVLDLNKPLPRTPLPCSPSIPTPHQEPVVESPVDPLRMAGHADTVGRSTMDSQSKAPLQGSSTYHQRSKHLDKEAQPTTWLKGLAAKALDTQHPFTASNKTATKRRDALKAQISRPIPISPTVTDMGDTSTALSLFPQDLPQHPGIPSEKARGKQKASPTWLAKFVHPTMPTMHKLKKRPASEESFACQGLVEENVYAAYMEDPLMDSGPSMQDGGPRMREAGDGDVDLTLKPQPLFSGAKEGHHGDSYGSHYGFHGENAGQGRTGRWI